MGVDARKRLKAGIDKCCNVVKVSMGGYGKNVLIYNGQNSEIINDGVSIAKAVEVKDEIEQAGIQLAKQCADMTNESAGDGTTTTLVLLQAILNEIITDLSIENPREVREQLFEEANKVLSNIDVKQISNREDIYNLALTSSLDEKIAGIIADIYWELGKDAKVTVEELQKDVLESEIVKGIQFDSKKADKAIIRSENKMVMENAHVLVCEERPTLETIQEKLDVIAGGDSKKLLVVSHHFDRNVIIAMLGIKTVDIVPVEFEEMKPIEDIKAYVGDVPVEKVIIADSTTTIIGGKGNVEDKIKLLKEKKEEVSSLFEKEELDKRIAGLSSGIAVIKIGKQTDVERNEYVLKIEDALNTVKGAYDCGYCKGGGKALADAGTGVIYQSPYNQICKNAGVSELEIPDTVIDSFKSVKESLLNALSTATSVLTVEAALIEEREEE